MLVYVQNRMLRSFKRSSFFFKKKKRQQKLKGLNVFGNLEMANYGTEIVWGLVRTAWGSLTSECTRLPTLARHFFIFEVALVAEHF